MTSKENQQLFKWRMDDKIYLYFLLINYLNKILKILYKIQLNMKNYLNRSLYSNSNSGTDCCGHKKMLEECSQNYKQRLSCNKNARSQKNIYDQHAKAESVRLCGHTYRKNSGGACVTTTRYTNCNCTSNESDSQGPQQIITSISHNKCVQCHNRKSMQHRHRQSRQKKLSKKITNMLIQQQHKSKIAGGAAIVSQSKQRETTNKIKFGEKSKKLNKQTGFLEDFTHVDKDLNGSQEFLLGKSQSSKASHYMNIQNPATFRNNNASINNQDSQLHPQSEFLLQNINMVKSNKIKSMEKGEENNKQNFNKQNSNQISSSKMQKLNDQQWRQVQERKSITLNNYIKSCQNRSISSNNLQSFFQHSSSINSQAIQNKLSNKSENRKISIKTKQTFRVNRRGSKKQSAGQLSDSQQQDNRSDNKNNINSQIKTQQNNDFTLKKKKKISEIEVLKQVRELKDIILNVLHLKQGKTHLYSDPDSRQNTIDFLENN